MNLKHTLIYFLSIVVAILLFINILIEPESTDAEQKILKVTSVKDTEQLFKNTLYDFGIKNEWIKQRRLNRPEFDSISHKYIVSVPQEVPIPQILKDLSLTIKKSNLAIHSTEKKNDGTTLLELKYLDATKLYAELEYDNNLIRNFSQIAFIINDFIEGDETSRQLIFKIQFPTGIILPLSNHSRDLAEKIKSSHRDYFIEINDNSNDLDIELTEDTGIENFDSGIRKVISLFNSPKYFFINTEESDYSQNTIDFIKEKFEARGRKIISVNTLKELKGENKADLHSLVDFHLDGLKPGDERIFLIGLDNWLAIQSEIIRYVKRGNKIIPPSNLL